MKMKMKMRDGETQWEYEMRTEPRRHMRLLIWLLACNSAKRYARRHRSLAAAWRACTRAGWMEWLIRNQIDRSPSGTFESRGEALAQIDKIMRELSARHGSINVYGAECAAACDELRRRYGTPQFVLDGRVVR